MLSLSAKVISCDIFWVTLGFESSIKSTLWAELYGEEVIGTVRSLFASIMVFSTAMSPFLFGWMLDQNIAIESILLVAIATVVAGFVLAFAVLAESKS